MNRPRHRLLLLPSTAPLVRHILARSAERLDPRPAVPLADQLLKRRPSTAAAATAAARLVRRPPSPVSPTCGSEAVATSCHLVHHH